MTDRCTRLLNKRKGLIGCYRSSLPDTLAIRLAQGSPQKNRLRVNGGKYLCSKCDCIRTGGLVLHGLTGIFRQSEAVCEGGVGLRRKGLYSTSLPT